MDRLPELGAHIARLAARDPLPTVVEGMAVFSSQQTTTPLGTVTEPSFALVAQGAKRVIVGDRVFDYHAGQYLAVTVTLPITARITHAAATEPFLAFGLALKPSIVAELLLEAGPGAGRLDSGTGIVMSDADEDLIDAVIRLLRLVDQPRDVRVLGPALEREIHWRLLTGPQGAIVRQIGLADSRLFLIGRAVRWIQANFNRVIRADDLAREVGMSVSSLNRHFRAVTAMSPLQYQKQIRLQQARLRLITAPADVAAIGYDVGYDSPSQFSREYRRLFGSPPGQDAARLQTTARGTASRLLAQAGGGRDGGMGTVRA